MKKCTGCLHETPNGKHNKMLEVRHSFSRLKRVNLSRLIGLPNMDFYLLHIIEEHRERCQDQRGIFVSEIADKAHIASSQVSRTLKHLEERGFIVRNVDSKDRRNTYVNLTEPGKEFCQNAYEMMEDFSGRVMARFGEARVEQLIQLCNELTDTMEQELKKEQ